ncbi:zinc-binding dehydrogenase domain-containing protein [Trichoderma breve]|uniref:Zinc-binding dehydrogenase domain-containing protein n=1 Tax=Trichoderma breve TaxID=2034170 RepID=A0A9W9EEQ7_9HYPO|nr:zinc-binding dehydrogenase domain-containing protein [Trichoderma breve]KAJ4865310.1 zinc-binding dehydrogenase domain-containing protein [Trichoderma breve]
MADNNVPQTRRALRRRGPHVAEFVDEAIPSRGSSDVLIQVRAVSLNYKDLAMLDDNFPWPVPSNVIMAADVAGEVVWVGDKVTLFEVGSRVAAIHNLDNITGRELTARGMDGTLATYVVFAEVELVKVPDNLTWAEASIVPCSGVTAWSALNMRSNNLWGKTVLVQGTGGVSIMALSLAAKAGATVIATSSSDAKLERAKKLGATHVINYKQNPNWDEEVLKLTGGLGVDIIIEQGGADSLLQSVQSIRREGQISQVGFLSGDGKGDLFRLVQLLIMKKCSIVGIQVGSKGDLEDLMNFLRQPHFKLDSCIDRIFSFDKSLEAFDYMRKGGAVGKIVIEF